MKIKKSLLKLIILTMLLAGCSNYQVQDDGGSLPDEATKQKTMTKVQNNMNEIMGKDYDYVLSNLGEPNAIAYLADKNKIYDIETIEDIETIDDIEKLTNINLVYLKDVSNEAINSSALFIEMKDKVVKNVQIVDYSSSYISKNLEKSKILIDCYTNGDTIRYNDLNGKAFNDLPNIEFSKINKIIENKKPSYDIYFTDKVDKSVNIYRLGNDKLLGIFTEDNKISQVEMLDDTKEVVTTIKHIMIDN